MYSFVIQNAVSGVYCALNEYSDFSIPNDVSDHNNNMMRNSKEVIFLKIMQLFLLICAKQDLDPKKIFKFKIYNL